MYDHVLVATDGSEVSRAATEFGLAVAGRLDTQLSAVYVTDSTRDPNRVLEEVSERARDTERTVRTHVIDSKKPVHRALIDYALEHDVDCLVVGTHGRDSLDRYVLGSVAERTLRSSPLPVVTVHEGTVTDGNFERILVPTDGSACAEAGADHAARLAAATGAVIHAVHAVDPDAVWDDVEGKMLVDELEAAGERAVDGVRERARQYDVPVVESTVLSGAPYRAILNYVTANDIDCVVMGTHGRTGIVRYLLGSVTERVVRLADVPVIGVKDADEIERLD